MEIDEKEFKKLVELAEGLNSKLESSIKEFARYSKILEETMAKAEALIAKAEKLLKTTSAGRN